MFHITKLFSAAPMLSSVPKISFVYSISDDAVYSIDFAMFLSEEKKEPSFFLSTKDKKVAISLQEHQRLNLGNHYHKNATKVARRIIEKF